MNAINIFDLPKTPFPEELVTILAQSSTVRIERIVSSGQVSDWYDQTEAELVVLLEGYAVIDFDNGKRISIAKGDTVLISPHERHKVSFTSTNPPCIWLCVFFN